MSEQYIQVGVTAMRDRETGEFLPAVPLYIKAEDADPQSIEKMVGDFAKLAVQRMRQYEEGCRKAGIKL